MKNIILAVGVFVVTNVLANVTVSDIQVFSGYPWREVVVGYTITGTDTEMDADLDVIQLVATDKSANKTYTARSLTGAVLTEGRHVFRWNAASEGAEFSSSNVVFSVAIVRRLGVQLWADGPYWAECNVGALKSEEYGYYFWWGETVGYKRNANNNAWISVKNGTGFSFVDSNCSTQNKHNSELQSAGYIDSTGNLVAAYDAATAYLGAPWRMPTDAEFSALTDKCDGEWTSLNGVAGRLIRGRGAYSSNSIFLPFAGYGIGNNLELFSGQGLPYGKYWSSTTFGSDGAQSISFDYFNWGSYFVRSDSRYFGCPVRPVRGFAK